MPRVKSDAVNPDDALLLPLGAVDLLDGRDWMAATPIDVVVIRIAKLESPIAHQPRTNDRRREEREDRKAVLRADLLLLERLKVKPLRRRNFTSPLRAVTRRRGLT